MKIKTLIYLHDTLGLGRLKRNLKLADALSMTFPEMSIRIVTGSSQAEHFNYPPRTDYLKLPSLYKTGDNSYSANSKDDVTENVMRLRSNILLNTVKEYAPDVFIIDHSHLAMLDEILPALEWNSKNNGKCVNIFGMREIIDDPEKVTERWSELGCYEIFRNHYDHILIYGNRDIFDSAEIYDFPEDIKSKVDYCGYLAEPANNKFQGKPQNNIKRITVTIGGGEWFGDVIIRNYIAMLEKFKQEIDFKSTIITGPALPDEYWNEFNNKSDGLDIDLHRFVSNTSEHLAQSDLVIGTAGYNTITDILSYARKAIVIPRVKFRTEQLMRAKIFDDLGILSMLSADEVSADSLYNKIQHLLNNSDRPIANARNKNMVNLDGARNACSHISRYLALSKVGIAK